MCVKDLVVESSDPDGLSLFRDQGNEFSVFGRGGVKDAQVRIAERAARSEKRWCRRQEFRSRPSDVELPFRAHLAWNARCSGLQERRR